MTEEVEVDWYADSDVQSPVKQETHPTGITEKTFTKGKGKQLLFKPEHLVIVKSSGSKNLESNLVVTSHDDIDTESQYIETIDMNIDMNDDGNEIIDEVLETDTAGTSQSKDEFLSEEFLTINESNEVLYDSSTKEIVISTKFPPKIANKIHVKRNKETMDSHEIVQQIKKFLIKDLEKTKIVDGSGFKDLIGFFSQNTEVPNSTEVWYDTSYTITLIIILHLKTNENNFVHL